MARQARRATAALRLELEPLEGRTLLSLAGMASKASAPVPASEVDLLVRFREGVSPRMEQAILTPLHARIIRTLPDGPSLVDLGSGVDPAAALRRLQSSRWVRYAEADVPIQVDDAVLPNDPQFYRQWGLSNPNGVDIDAPLAWSITTGVPGPGTAPVIVAVIDSGIDLSNPEFAGRIWTDPATGAHGWNFLTNSSNVADDNGHGTHVAGIIAAAGNNGYGIAGVDWGATIMPLKFINANGDGTIDQAVQAIYYAVDHGARVINASWGGSTYSQALKDAIAYANAHNVVFVTAAGNESANNDYVRSYPADNRLPNLLSVAAVDPSGNLASFSNYGPTTVDLAAPGVGIRSVIPGGYATYSGTSMAAPFVSGTVALVASQHPDWTASQLVGRVLATAKPLPALQGLVISGGIVDAGLALTPDQGGSSSVAAQHAALSDDAVQARLFASDEYFLRHGGTNAGFVAGLYHDLLGRDLDPLGASVWIGKLASGESRMQVVQAIQASPEALRTKVARWFQGILGWTSSIDEIKSIPTIIAWSNELAAGARDDAIQARIYASEEYYLRHGGTDYGFVAGLYNDLLGRGLDPLGAAVWVGKLALGESRMQVVQAIQASPEALRTKVARWFLNDLGWTATLDQVKSIPTIIDWANELAS
ncbi:MAG: S8 family serine peptidase [Isosphaeraceae bacterium]|nr:S8 family serine peptidase [Isosphaeraceae bacterium]